MPVSLLPFTLQNNMEYDKDNKKVEKRQFSLIYF